MIHILIVGERQQDCQRLKRELQQAEEMSVVGSASTLDQALHQAQYADVVLVHAAAETEKTVAMVQRLVLEHEAIRVLATGVEEGAGEILTYLEAGAAGYIARDDSREKLLQKVGAAGRNEAVRLLERGRGRRDRVRALGGRQPLNRAQGRPRRYGTWSSRSSM